MQSKHEILKWTKWVAKTTVHIYELNLIAIDQEFLLSTLKG